MTVGVEEAGRMRRGDKVSIALPDAREIPGRVTSVSTTVQGGEDEGAEVAYAGAPASVRMTVVPDDGASVGNLDSATVRVTCATQTRRGVLVVPVGALLALQEGGYALQRPDGRLVAVRTGLFARGRVEVSGAGLAEGQRVVTAS